MKLNILAADLYARALLGESELFSSSCYAMIRRDEEDEFSVSYLSKSHATLDYYFQEQTIYFGIKISAKRIKLCVLQFLERFECDIVQPKYRIKIGLICCKGRGKTIYFRLEKEDLCHA